jgi:hypothetical protein
MPAKTRRSQPRFKQSMRRAARAFVILVAPLVPAALYLAVAIASRIPVNDDWREPDGGITIFVQTNGVHTGVVVPANAAGVDRSNRVHPGDASGWSAMPRWLAFGWGDRDFYLNRPTWAEFSFLRGLKAVTGQGSTLVHVDLLEDVRPGYDKNVNFIAVETRSEVRYEANWNPGRDGPPSATSRRRRISGGRRGSFRGFG